jgi:hypothetical protein
VYYDKNRVLRSVLLRQSFTGVEFTGDHRINSQDRSYFEDEMMIKTPQKQKVEPGPVFVDYTYNYGTDKITVKQQFYQPNKGEAVLLNDIQAPNGKYKIGFMNYIYIQDGKIKDLTMF